MTMDIETMQYYLRVIQEGTISGAARALHIAQPALSRRMKELEEELGVQLFVRGNRKIVLSDEGVILRKRAEEIIRLMHIAEDELLQAKERVAGTVRIGAGESRSFSLLAKTAGELMAEYPDIRIHITSGDTQDLLEELDKGLIDCAVIFTNVDHTAYQAIPLPEEDRFGVLLRKDHPLAQKEELTFEDLQNVPVMVSRASESWFSSVSGDNALNVIGTYNLIYNASLLVENRVCCALAFDGLINTTGDSPLCFRPLMPVLSIRGSLIRRKYQPASPALQHFIERLQNRFK